MAITVSISSGVTEIDRAEALGTGGVGWFELGSSSKLPALEPDFIYQGTASISEKVGTTPFGVNFIDNAGVDYSSPNAVAVMKVLATNPSVLNVKGADGMIIRIGSALTIYNSYYVEGGNTYPPQGGWLIKAIDPNEAAYADANTGGAINLNSITYYGLSCDFTGTSKAENVAADAIEKVEYGHGLLLVGNTPSGVFQDYVDFDEGTSTQRHGFVSTLNSVIYVVGRLIIGSATATTFTDSNATVVFPAGLHAAGFGGLTFDLQSGSTAITITDSSFKGTGTAAIVKWFDTAIQVNLADDTINIPAHDYVSGDYILYSKNGGADAIGLTDATNYWVYNFLADYITLHTTRIAAIAGTSPVAITEATTPGENHKITRVLDTRPDLDVTSTSGTAALTGVTFNNFNDYTCTTVVTFTNCIFLFGTSFTQSGASLTTCTIAEPIVDEGVAFITSTDLADISGCTFTSGATGHAIKLTSAAGTPFTWNSFHSGYGSNGSEFSTAQAFTSELLTTDSAHGFTTGDAVYYNKGGGTAAIGLTNLAKYYVEVASTTTLYMHATSAAAAAPGGAGRINLTTNGTDTHTLYSANAVLFNDTGTAIVINVTTGTDPPTIRNGSGATTTVNASVPIEIAGTTEGAAVKIVALTSVGSVTAGDTILETLADSAGEASVGFNYEGDIDVVVRVRQQGLPNAAIAEDSGVFTNETTAANSSTTTDMNLIPATTPAVNDAYYFGHNETFSKLKLEISQIFTGTTLTLAWEYYNGSIWTALSGVVDGCSSTKGFDVLGENTVSWTVPGSWTDITVNSQGPYKMVRARVTAIASMTQQPKARRCKLAVTRYLPFSQDRTIGATGLTVFVTWVEDVIATF